MGLSVKFHDECLPADSSDDEGIAYAAEHKWLYVTADHGRGGLLLRAVEACGAKCFILQRVNHLSASEKAAIVQSHAAFMLNRAERQDGPFAYRLYASGNRVPVPFP